jgi:hypothetical protein
MPITLKDCRSSGNGGYGLFVNGDPDLHIEHFVAENNRLSGYHFEQGAPGIERLIGQLGEFSPQQIVAISEIVRTHLSRDISVSSASVEGIKKNCSFVEYLSELGHSVVVEAVGRAVELILGGYFS